MTDAFITNERADIASLDREIIELVRDRAFHSHNIQTERVMQGGTRTDLNQERLVIERYTRELGPAGQEIAEAVLRLSRGRL